MKRILFFLFTILCISNGLQAQLSEKFLKLNRVVTLDSVKTKTFNNRQETIFSVTVPAGVYWKIESINFKPSRIQPSHTGSGSFYFYSYVKINSVDLIQSNNFNYNNFYTDSSIDGYPSINPFFTNIPVWAGPGSVIIMYGYYYNTSNNYTSNPQITHEMVLNAMEFIVE
jgi:hypothetical protein